MRQKGMKNQSQRCNHLYEESQNRAQKAFPKNQMCLLYSEVPTDQQVQSRKRQLHITPWDVYTTWFLQQGRDTLTQR